jgi:hypothetical protein
VEIWNEPDHPQRLFWRARDPAADYAALLRAAYPAAKAGNRSVPVLAGSLTASSRYFLRRLYAHGIRGSYDALADHAYADIGFAKLRGLRQEQLAHGDRKPIWVTEFGWPTGSDPRWHVGEAAQAASIRQGFADLARLGWVRGAFLYNLRDKGWNARDLEDNFGVVRRNFAPKPSFAAVRQALRGR